MSDMHPDDEAEDVVSQLEGLPSLRELVLELLNEVHALRQEVSLLRSQIPYVGQYNQYQQQYYPQGTSMPYPNITYANQTAPQARSRQPAIN